MAAPVQRTLVTDDGVPISAAYRPTTDPHDVALVVAHGFTGSWRGPLVRRVVDRLARYGAVVAFDFRGHGRSGGVSTVGDREVLDLDAAVRWARVLGHERVAVVGFSMGASVVVRYGGLRRGAADAVVSVSGPAFWYYRGTAPMRLLHRGIETRTGRALLRTGWRTRVTHVPWPDPPPLSPVAAAELIAPTPLLVVHGESDAYFPVEHATALHAAAVKGAAAYGADGSPAQLWVENFGHAEKAVPDVVLDRIGRWVRDVLGDGAR